MAEQQAMPSVNLANATEIGLRFKLQDYNKDASVLIEKGAFLAAITALGIGSRLYGIIKV